MDYIVFDDADGNSNLLRVLIIQRLQGVRNPNASNARTKIYLDRRADPHVDYIYSSETVEELEAKIKKAIY